MLNRNVTKAVRLALAFGAGSAGLMSTQAFAEEAEESAEKVERIQVTGSRISRTDLETATPVSVFTAVEIEKSGVSTVAEFLRENAATGGFNESATLSQAAGASSIGLRGFADVYTLVLLNGRRIPKNSAGGVFTDINQIPMAAVERIDILPDGASAIYGSDAVAGVINIVTKSDYQGVEATAKYGMALEENDGEEIGFQLTAGASSDNTNVLFSLDYFERRPIMAKDRELGSTAYIPDMEGGDGRSNWGVPGRLFLGSPTAAAEGEQGWAPWATCPAESIRGTACAYDFAPLYQLQPASDRQSIFTSISHQYSDDLKFDGQFRYTRAYTKTSNAPAPGAVDITNSPFLEDFVVNTQYADNPELGQQIYDEIAAGDGFAYVGRRYLDFPNRQKDNTNETFEAVTGFDYFINNDWTVDFDLGFSRLTNRQVGAGGQLLAGNLEAAFADGTLNPFVINDCSSDALKQFCDDLNSAIHRTSEYEVSFATTVVSGLTSLELPGGLVGVAAGIDYRRENYLDRSDQASVDGDVIGGAGSNGGGFSTNEAAFIELSLPVIEGMEVSLAARNDAADWGLDSASETTYSVKASYRPTDAILIRGSYGTGFRAPSLDNLYLAESQGVQTAVDTKLCNAAIAAGGSSETSPECRQQEINSKSGGNPSLQPETSTSYNLGVVVDVTEELSATVDYWSLEIENQIGSLAIQEILDAEAIGNLTNLVIRNSEGTLTDSNRNGYVRTQLENLNVADSKGINVNINYATDLSFGALSADLKVEHFLEQNRQNSAVQPLCDNNVDTRDYRLNGSIGLDSGDWSTNLNMRFLPGYSNYEKFDTDNKTCDVVGFFDVDKNIDEDGNVTYADYGRPVDVASYFQLDLTTAYTLDESQTVTFGLRNLFDRQPVRSGVNDWPFYSQSTFNNVGRFAYLQYDIKF